MNSEEREVRYLHELDISEHEFKRFKHDTDADPDMDDHRFIREFTGRMTPKRHRILEEYCNHYSYTPSYGCGHDYDCCGCFCGQYLEFTYEFNQVTIRLRRSYNY